MFSITTSCVVSLSKIFDKLELIVVENLEYYLTCYAAGKKKFGFTLEKKKICQIESMVKYFFVSVLTHVFTLRWWPID